MSEQIIKILIIDDDKAYVDVIRHQLRPFQNKVFNLTAIQDPEKAILTLKQENIFDLILLDYFLQGTNGIEISKIIHSLNIQIPIVLLTSNKDFRIAIEAMKYGVEDYLIKEEAVDTILPRTIINVIDKVNLSKRINEAEKEQMMTGKKMEAVQELIVTMCHEFNNPLAAIKISTDILMRQSVSAEQKLTLSRFNENIGHLEKQIVLLRDLNIDK
ncbi:MAG: response regulator [Ignavibacteriales bacterium]|nr:response regulator [Ignavibacteriales bacterium]